MAEETAKNGTKCYHFIHREDIICTIPSYFLRKDLANKLDNRKYTTEEL